jgi:hypothetical protein
MAVADLTTAEAFLLLARQESDGKPPRLLPIVVRVT